MSAKICPFCDDQLASTSPVAKKYAEDGIPPCNECLQEKIDEDQPSEEDLEAYAQSVLDEMEDEGA